MFLWWTKLFTIHQQKQMRRFEAYFISNETSMELNVKLSNSPDQTDHERNFTGASTEDFSTHSCATASSNSWKDYGIFLVAKLYFQDLNKELVKRIPLLRSFLSTNAGDLADSSKSKSPACVENKSKYTAAVYLWRNALPALSISLYQSTLGLSLSHPSLTIIIICTTLAALPKSRGKKRSDRVLLFQSPWR